MRIETLKQTVQHQRELDRARRLVQRAFGAIRGSYHYEYLD